MNESRKKIIDLIEPYMDKTLNEWCIIEIKKSYEYWKWKDIDPIYTTITHLSWDGLYAWIYRYWTWERDVNWKFRNWHHWDAIIWHYDITAVLKYIENKWCSITFNWYWEIRVYLDNSEFWKTLINLTLKPLHLYTEEEEKELLETLNTLNK